MVIQDFIKKHPYLMWYARDLKGVSEEAVVEAVLNYGDFDDVKEIIGILGIKKISRIFHNQVRKKRNNYDPRIEHYFKLYFKKYA